MQVSLPSRNTGGQLALNSAIGDIRRFSMCDGAHGDNTSFVILLRLHQILPLKPWGRSCTSTSARKSSALPKQGLCRSNRDRQDVVANVSLLSPRCDGWNEKSLVPGTPPNRCLYCCC